MATKWQATAATTSACHTSWYPKTRGNGSGQRVNRNTAPTVKSTPPTAMSTSSAIDMLLHICGMAATAAQPSPM